MRAAAPWAQTWLLSHCGGFLAIWSAASSSAIMEIADSSDKVGAIGIFRPSLS